MSDYPDFNLDELLYMIADYDDEFMERLLEGKLNAEYVKSRLEFLLDH